MGTPGEQTGAEGKQIGAGRSNAQAGFKGDKEELTGTRLSERINLCSRGLHSQKIKMKDELHFCR